MGLDDLNSRIARTPLPPRQTFHDDPLRILRCVRFASRFGLIIAEEVEAAILDVEVKASRIRILDSLMSGCYTN
jgi:tRNA nucleotidyltransferase (CCA-adding enzyme)